MNEAKHYEDRINDIYVDFYKIDTNFNNAFNVAIDETLEINDRAYDRILNDVITLDLSKVEKLCNLL